MTKTGKIAVLIFVFSIIFTFLYFAYKEVNPPAPPAPPGEYKDFTILPVETTEFHKGRATAPEERAIINEYIDSLVVVKEDTSNLSPSYWFEGDTTSNKCDDFYWYWANGSGKRIIEGHSWTYKTPQWEKRILGIELNERICTNCLLWQSVKIYHFKRKVLSDYERAMLQKGRKSK